MIANYVNKIITILLYMPAIRCYIGNEGTDAIRTWCDGLPPAVQAAVDVTLETLTAQPRKWWRRKSFANLNNAPCAGLGEIRIDVNGEQFRIFGYDVPGSDTFALLYGFKKSCDPNYQRSCPIAQGRKVEVENDPTRTKECNFP